MKATPRSQYIIQYTTKDGTTRKHIGVAVGGNALISSNHLLPEGVAPNDVMSIQIMNTHGDTYQSPNESYFKITVSGEYTVIVFSNTAVPDENVASIGSVEELVVGDYVEQSVSKGTSPGVYPTRIQSIGNLDPYSEKGYIGIGVNPDLTIVGDSGSPLYLNDQTVVGVNNSGSYYAGFENPVNLLASTNYSLQVLRFSR